MTVNEQIQHFGNELDNLVDRLRNEYDLPYAAVVGTLQMKAHLLMNEAEREGMSEDSNEN